MRLSPKGSAKKSRSPIHPVFSTDTDRFCPALLKVTTDTSDKFDMNVTPAQFDTLTRLLSISEFRHHVISQNIANVNTPGYRRRDVSFEDAVKQILDAETGETSRVVEPEIREVEGLPLRADGNNVDIDREMGELGKNSLLYQTLAQVLASRLATMRSAITGK